MYTWSRHPPPFRGMGRSIQRNGDIHSEEWGHKYESGVKGPSNVAGTPEGKFTKRYAKNKEKYVNWPLIVMIKSKT